MKFDFAKATELFLPLVKEEKFQVRIVASLQLGACHIMTGEREKGIEIFNKMLTYPGKKGNLDSIILRQAKRYLANGGYFSAFELLYIRRDLAKMTPITPLLLKTLEELAGKTKALESREVPVEAKNKKFGGKTLSSLKAFSSPLLAKSGLGLFGSKTNSPVDYYWDDRASYLLIKGSLLKALNKQDEAMDCYREVIDIQECLTEKLYVPYCMYELGECHYIKGNLKEAEETMKKCSKWSGYDWEDPLRVRLRVTMDQLKKGLTPSDEPVLSLDNLTVGSDKEMPSDEEIDEKAMEDKAKEEDDD